jgi:energy-coupling factor transporter ATP-binding protein EcfA2
MNYLTIKTKYNYNEAWLWLQQKGIQVFGNKFMLHEEDKPQIYLLLCYFLQDNQAAQQLNLNLNKGILLTGPVGCGKTSLMQLMKFFIQKPEQKFVIKACRDISFEFIEDGFSVIQRYSKLPNLGGVRDGTYCFDDLGVENSLKYYGNECNVMAEILLSRYDLFVSHNLITHLTTNLSASEIEETYGNRVRSRMRTMFNLIAFDRNSEDKRK